MAGATRLFAFFYVFVHRKLFITIQALLKVLENSARTVCHKQPSAFLFFVSLSKVQQYLLFNAYILLIEVTQIFSFMVITEVVFVYFAVFFFTKVILTDLKEKVL